jgi:hypothetical protein
VFIRPSDPGPSLDGPGPSLVDRSGSKDGRDKLILPLDQLDFSLMASTSARWELQGRLPNLAGLGSERTKNRVDEFLARI